MRSLLETSAKNFRTSSAAEALISKGSARYSVPVVMLGEDGRLFRVELKSSAKPQNSTAF